MICPSHPLTLSPSHPLALSAYYAFRLDRGFLADRSPRTRKEYWSTIRRFEQDNPGLGLPAISAETLEQWVAVLLDGSPAVAIGPQALLPGFDGLVVLEDRRGLAKATAQKHQRNVKRLLRDAYESGAVAAVPRMRLIRIPRPRPRPVPPEKLLAIHAACETATWPRSRRARHRPPDGLSAPGYWRAILTLALSTGLRHEALDGLRWADVDWRDRVLFVQAASDKCDEARAVALSDEAVKCLLTVRGDRERILPWPFAVRTWYRSWHAIQDAAGLAAPEHITLHELRDTFGTTLAAAGCGAHLIQAAMGHASIRTSEHYVMVSPEVRSRVEAIRLPWAEGACEMAVSAG